EHPTDLVRDQYLMDVAGRCRVQPDRLRTLLEELRARPARRPAAQGRRGTSGSARRGTPGGRGPAGGHSGTRPDGRGNGSRRPSAEEGPAFAGDPDGRTIENRPDDLGDIAGQYGATLPSSGPQGSSRPSGAPRRSAGAAPARRDGPAVEVLRHAVHDPAAVAQWLDDTLFDDAVHLGA